MTKVSRNLLKDLVKECLVEILSEGLSSTPTTSSPAIVSEARSRTQQHKKRRRAADLMTVSQEQQPKKSAAIENRIKQVAGGNNIMESILRDTAQNTLPAMLAGDRRDGSAAMMERVSRGDGATKAMAGADPMDIFEGASNWAALAFSDKPKQ